MRTFDRYMELKNMEPLIYQAARLMVETNVDPEEYLSLLSEVGHYDQAHQYAQQAGTNAIDATFNAGRAASSLGQAGWQAGSNAAKAMGNSAMGQGIKGWWQDFNSADRKLERAAGLIQKAMSDPNVVSVNGGSDKAMLDKIIAELTSIAQRVKNARKMAGEQQPQQPGQPQQPQQQPSGPSPVQINQPHPSGPTAFPTS